MSSHDRAASAASDETSVSDAKKSASDRTATAAVEALYRAERPGLLRQLRRRSPTSDDALDLVHDAFVRLLGLGSARILALDDERPGAYLNRTAGNIVRDQRKSGARRSAHLHVVADEATLAGHDPVRQIEARDELRRYEEALLQLRPKPRGVYIAHRIDGLSYAEIARQYGISVKGVEKHMAYAIATMNRLINRD